MRVSQVEIEPVLKRAIDAHANVDVRFGVEFRELRQDADGVTATVRDTATGPTDEIRCTLSDRLRRRRQPRARRRGHHACRAMRGSCRAS